MSRRYYYHSELQHHKDQPWVISKRGGLCVDLKSGVDPTADDPKEWRSDRGSKLWSECGAAARMKIMEAFVEHLKAKRKKERRKEVNQSYYGRNNSKADGVSCLDRFALYTCPSSPSFRSIYDITLRRRTRKPMKWALPRTSRPTLPG